MFQAAINHLLSAFSIKFYRHKNLHFPVLVLNISLILLYIGKILQKWLKDYTVL